MMYNGIGSEMKATVGGGLAPFTIKDSGARTSFDSGMVRDVTEGKIDYSLVLDGPMFERYAKHLTAGAAKYDKRNWMKARGTAERERFRESALRHFVQWYRGDTDEDHAAAVFFNINGKEYVDATAAMPMAPAPTPTRALHGQRQCPADSRWRCERPAGHPGKHMAWANYEHGILYDGGEW